MSEQVNVEVSAAGRPVAVKRATEDDRRARLRHEAAMLELARHPGVIELVELEDGDDETVLTTTWVGGGTFPAVDVDLAPKKLAGLGASLASTVADLHDRALAHRRITPDHVLLDGLGRVIVTGFAEATAPPNETETATDVADIGALLGARLPTDLAAIAKLRRTGAEREVTDRLRAVVTRACDVDPSRRPSARALSGLLAEIAGEPVASGPIRLPRPTSPEASRSTAPHPLAPALAALGQLTPRLATRARVILLGLTATVVVGFGAHAALAGDAPRDRAIVQTSSLATDVPATTQVRAPTTTASTRVWPTSVACPPLTLPGDRRDVDGDGCPEAVTIDGEQVVVDGERFAVGAPGDAVAVADWDCDGLDTPAVVRPSTGDVFVFDAWATADTPLPARELSRVPDAIAPAMPDGTCDVVPVVDGAGTRSAVPLQTEERR